MEDLELFPHKGKHDLLTLKHASVCVLVAPFHLICPHPSPYLKFEVIYFLQFRERLLFWLLLISLHMTAQVMEECSEKALLFGT